jgi:hypothetical protein
LDESVRIEAGYYIGIDWLIEGHSSIIVAPKLDTRIEEVQRQISTKAEDEIEPGYERAAYAGKSARVDYLAMLNQCLAIDILYREIENLVYIDWSAKEIPIRYEQDILSPLLIIQYLNTLRKIVRKGLKKSYYQVTENLNSKIKGKILVARNIRQNLLKNKHTSTYCRFEEFGVNSLENRLLKKAFAFACAYIENYGDVFSQTINDIRDLISYCRPAFDLVSDEVRLEEIKNYQANLFFSEYSEGVLQAKAILRRYSYTVSNISNDQLTTPPYWIDIPRLFELYAYYFLRSKFQENKQVLYHTRTYGNELDFLVNAGNTKMVVDAKYKPLYIYGKNHQDIRQVAGYARLSKISAILEVPIDELIDCLIIYPDIVNGHDLTGFDRAELTAVPISGYNKVYKVGIKLPLKG